MRKYIGDKAFYSMLFAVLIPIVVQSSISNFVNLLDNLMVGSVGTEEMSGVAIANQLLMIFNICIFGGLSGAGIFTSQFFGSKNDSGIRETFRIKVFIGTFVLLGFTAVFLLFPRQLISLYLTAGEGAGDLEKTLAHSLAYLRIMLVGNLPFVITNIYASTVRECGKTVLPMKAGIAAVLSNLVLNYLLIFGHFGFPRLGVEGAALATVLSRFVETSIMVITVHAKKQEYGFLRGVYKTLHVRLSLFKNVMLKGLPLLANEFLWSLGVATALQAYSSRGLAVVAALNISGTVSNTFNVVCMSMGSAVAIIVGQSLGAGETDEARDRARKLIAFNVAMGLLFGGIMFAAAPFIPLLYNTTETVRGFAGSFIRVSAVTMPVFAFLHTCYFTLRSGGKTIITFIFDSGFMWVVTIPLAYCLVLFTPLPITPLYLICQLADLIKCVVGYVFLKKGVWIHNMAAENA